MKSVRALLRGGVFPPPINRSARVTRVEARGALRCPWPRRTGKRENQRGAGSHPGAEQHFVCVCAPGALQRVEISAGESLVGADAGL